jgi:outer membrane protein assembly factor BamB
MTISTRERKLASLITLSFVAALVSCNGATTQSVASAAPPVPAGNADVVSYHKDNARTGQYNDETVLTPANVNSIAFGKVAFFATDGRVDAQPLYLSAVNMPGVGSRDVLYVVTEHGSAYAFDAASGAQLWKTSALGAAETPSDTLGCGQVTPEIGITATPVIDRAQGTIYFVAMSKSAAGRYFQRLHALDVTTGAELFGGPSAVSASYPGNGANSQNGQVVFDPMRYEERAGLLLLNGTLYTAWTSHCDQDPYTGWIMGFDATTLHQTGVLNVTPNGSRGAFWMAGAGIAADSAGAIYLISGNGTFDETLDANGFPVNGDFGNGLLKISSSGGLAIADYFATFDTTSLSNADTDFGSGGLVVLPDLIGADGRTRHLAVGAGKDAKIYIVDRDAMGKFSNTANNNYQTISGALGGGVYAAPAWFNGALYYGAAGDQIKAFPITNALLATTPSSQTTTSFPYPGATPSISSNANANGIVWAVENAGTAVLHAYDATNLASELYNSSQAANGIDQFGAGNKFVATVIVNGRVYVGTPTGVAAFGLR